MSVQVIIELSDRQGVQTVLQALETYKNRLRASIVRTEQRLAGFERRYGVTTAKFLTTMAAEDLDGQDQEYVDWVGESKLLEGLVIELAEIPTLAQVLAEIFSLQRLA